MFTDFRVIAEIDCAIAFNPTSHQRTSSLANSSTPQWTKTFEKTNAEDLVFSNTNLAL